MACESMVRPGQTREQRREQVKRAVKALEARLGTGAIRVVVDRTTGAVAFSGWTYRDGVTDACAFRVLTAASSWALRQAVARAEAAAGRKVNAAAINAGVHSHDGGATWGRH